MTSPPPDQPNPSAWTVTKAEFDGWSARLGRRNGLLWFGLVMVALVAGTAMMWLSERASMRVLAVVLAGFTGWQLLTLWRRARHSHAMAEEIWRREGAVCPHCLVPMGATPCKHGLTDRDAAALREFWEAGLRGDVTGVVRLNALIASRTPRGFARVRRLRERAFMAVMDPTKPLWKRLLGAMLAMGLSMAAVMAAVQWASMGEVPTPFGLTTTVLQYGLGFGGIMIASLAWSGIGTGRNRCKACSQIIAPGREQFACTECGADLRAAGAVVSGERRRDARTALIGAAIGVTAMFFVPAVLQTSMLSSVMPSQVLIVQYKVSSPVHRWGITRELTSRSLDPETTAAFCDTLIADASTSPGAAILDSDFIGRALIAGTVGPEVAERALRASIELRVEAPSRVRAGEPFEIRLVPSFGTDLFETSHVTLVAFRGVDMGGTVVRAPERWYTAAMMNPRGAASSPPRLSGVVQDQGEHTLRMRAWVVLIPANATAVPRTPSFDDAGNLVAPNGAVVVEFTDERTIEVDG
ncbi:MAG: hypothetical protein LW636_01425 [Planctomycetaceae bacterium]|nr:hypothetical protein [Planctomycetaceae bacterium]